MAEHTIPAGERRRSAIQCGILLAMLILPVQLLTWLQPYLPNLLVQIAFLMILPAAASAAYWMSRSSGGCCELGLVRPVNWLRTLVGGLGVGLGMLLVAYCVLSVSVPEIGESVC